MEGQVGGGDQGHGQLGGERADQGEGDHRAGLHQHACCLHGSLHWRQHWQDDCQDLNSIFIHLLNNKSHYLIRHKKFIERASPYNSLVMLKN